MDKSICASNQQILKKLVESFKTLQIKHEDRFIDLDSALKKSSYDLSKTISGYNDEESSEDENTSHSDKTISSLVLESVLKHKRFVPLYPPSTEIKIAHKLKFSTNSLRNNFADVKTFLIDSKISKDNAHFVYKMLLEMEDITSMSEYVPLRQKDVVVNDTDNKWEFWISLKDCPRIEDVVAPLIDEVVLVPKASRVTSEVVPLEYMTDILLPHPDESSSDEMNVRYVGTVRKITKDRVYFRFNKTEYSLRSVVSLLQKKFDIIFRPSRHPVRYQHYALDVLAVSADVREYLFPEENPHKELVFQPKFELKLVNTAISSNPEQLEAIHYIVKGPNINAPFVIFGPPGTGKTTLIVESILQILLHHPQSYILVTAGSNSACDTIALRICKYFTNNPCLRKNMSIIRIYSKNYIKKRGILSIHPELLKCSNIKKKIPHYPSFEEIYRYRIIVATLCTVGKYVTCHYGKMGFFTHIFIDEAAASSIPEALVGIIEVKSKSNGRLILSGDHKQLGPVLKSERAAQLGLRCSLIEHLMSLNCYAVDKNGNYDCTLQARLKRNYRSHPEIVRLYNNLYYKNELIAEAKEEDVNMAAKWRKLPNPKFPIIFQAAHGVIEKNNASPSLFNRLEVQVVMWFVRRLLIDGINGHKLNQSDIGIITPYKLQSLHIRNCLKNCDWTGVETGSVETFQGLEKQIIIVSFVRSFSDLGFVANPKRLNVLLSRPKSLLILIGNPLTLRRNSHFAYIMDECKKHGTFMRRNKDKKQKDKFR